MLKWAIEQLGASGAIALILISDVATGAGLRWAHLRKAGVPREEFGAFAHAALELIRNRLSYVIKPVVDSSRYASIRGISKAKAPGGVEGIMMMVMTMTSMELAICPRTFESHLRNTARCCVAIC